MGDEDFEEQFGFTVVGRELREGAEETRKRGRG